ncbi:hypothetical protein SNE40_020072 [Patella caerulea]|uniref:Transcription initiation factor TFIID subunit 12 n=1 Tax=Patella caerulea TaxID=87958 RepID=A0AAN8G6U6_PATCE
MTSTPDTHLTSTTITTAVPALSSPSKVATPINYADTIKQLEQQISFLGSGPYTQQQKEEFDKLNILLERSRQEQLKITNPLKATMDSNCVSPGITAIAGLSQSSPMAMTNSPTPIAMSPVIRPAAPYVPAPAIGSTSASSSEGRVLDKRRLQELVKEVDPLEQLDDDVEEVLLQVADDFIENVVSAACQIAKHRKSNTLEVKDVQLYLERTWNMWLPGFGSDDVRPFKKACVTEAHKQRMALIRKTLKKY